MARDDDEEEEHQGDWWIVAHWFLGSSKAYFEAIYNENGKPSLAWAATGDPSRWYRWKSYHAARKWMREQTGRNALKGYTVCNLSEMMRLSKEWHRANFRSQYKEGGGPLE